MQPDLFEWQPPKPAAVVVCLPSWVKRDARETAARVYAMPAAERARAVYDEDARFYLALHKRGVDAVTADRAAHSFTAVVRLELHRLRWLGRPRDGAA